MVQVVSGLRLKMLIWLMLPMVMVVLVTCQLLGVGWPSKVSGAANNQFAVENDEATVIPTIPPFKYQNTGLVTIWFDDAWSSQYEIGQPTLEKYGFKAALAVPTRVVGSYNYMTWLDVKRLQYLGWEITSHSRVHNCDMANAKQPLIDDEVTGSLEDLKLKGLEHDIYVTPCGVQNLLIQLTVKKDYPGGLRTSNTALNPLPVPDKYNMTVMAIEHTTTPDEVRGWLKEAKAQHKWAILLFHRLDNPTNQYDTDQKNFVAIMAVVKESGLPVVLPSQALSIPGTNKGLSVVPVTTAPVIENQPEVIASDPELVQSDQNDNSGSSDSSTPTPSPSASASISPSPSVSPTASPTLIPLPTLTPLPTSTSIPTATP